MTESTFSDQNYWLDNLAGNLLQDQDATESDKRKWHTLNDLPEPFIKHFNNGGDNDLLAQLTKQINETSDAQLSPSEVRQKRKEQNRAAQRAFRERREQYVKNLTEKVADLEQHRINDTKQLREENEELRLKVKQMEAEIFTLKGAENAFKLSIQKLRETGIQIATDTTTPLATPPSSSESSFSDISTASKQQYASPASISGTNSMESSFTATNNRFLEHQLHDVQSSTSSLREGHHQHLHPENHQSSNNIIVAPDGPLPSEKGDPIGFAASETDRFNHQPDPLVEQGAKLIPYSQIWEKVQDHPKYELFDIDRLCEDLKKKARCSGSGAVILEEDFDSIMHKHDI